MMNGALLASTRALVARFWRRRPLRSGSLLITLLGDSVMPRGGAITLGSLIRLAQPFGLSERLVRTTVARVAQLGLLEVRREGRRSEYRLSAQGRRRFAEATLRIYGAGPRSWDGRWTLLLLASPARLDERLRRELRWLGFGQLSAHAYVHPSYSLAAARRRAAELGMRDCLTVQATTDSLAVDRRLLAASWDLHELGRRYGSFITDFGAVSRALELDARAHRPRPLSEPALLEAAFIVRTLLIHEYRKIHLRDPQLPPALLPPGWVGGEAYELCRHLYRALFGAAEQFLATHAQSLAGSLPAPARATYARFGGLPAPRGRRAHTRAVQRAAHAVAHVP